MILELLVHGSWAKCMDFVLSDNHLAFTSEDSNESVIYKIEIDNPSVAYRIGMEMAVQMGYYKEDKDMYEKEYDNAL